MSQKEFQLFSRMFLHLHQNKQTQTFENIPYCQLFLSVEMQKERGGYAFNLLLRKEGLFLAQLRVTTGKDDPNPPDLHVALYDGKTVRDNGKYTKVKILEDYDRTVLGARHVFDSLFHGLEVRINNIYELRRA